MGSDYAWSPELLKPIADMQLANGLNKFVIHTSVHQPVDDKIPGLSLGPFGQWFTRHETWAEQAIAWTTYLARSSYMLQQGNFIADIAYFYGEDNNITALFGQRLPEIPQGYEYDFVNADILINVLKVKQGNITSPGGMNYKLLVLDPNSRNMSLPVLRRIREIVAEGAFVTGPKPVKTPSLADNPDEFDAIVNELWANEKGENNIGKGTLYSGYSLDEVLNLINLQPDFSYEKSGEDTELLYVHRKLGDVDFYWVNNRNNRVENIDASFRINGRSVEIWNPVTGSIEEESYVIEGNITKVPLNLEPNDAIFVVFRNKAKWDAYNTNRKVEQQLAQITGEWDVSFQENRGAPAQMNFESLTPWNENTEAGIRYFSGTATYKKTITILEEWLNQEGKLIIDLGDVQNLAEIILNGQNVGILWKTPFRADITSYLKTGENILEIKVTNLWVNRLIGDQQPGTDNRITYTTRPFYQADSPLKPSGLMGPVNILNIKND